MLESALLLSGRYGPLSDWFEEQGALGWVLLFGGIAVMLIVGTFFERRTEKKVDTSWRGSADRLGLDRYEDIASGGDVLRGEIDGYPVTVEPTVALRVNHAAALTLHGVLYPAPIDLEFKLEQNRTLPRIGSPKASMILDDPDFDSRVVIVSVSDEAAMLSYLTQERCDALTRLFSRRERVLVTERHAHVIAADQETDENHLMATVETLVALASVLEPAKRATIS